MNSELRQFLSSAEQLGYTFVGLNGGGHPILHNETTGVSYCVPSTPSDWRSMQNCMADIERLAGRKLPRPNAGHYRHRRQRQLDTRLSDAEKQRGSQVEALAMEAESLRRRFEELTFDAKLSNVDEARAVVRRFEHIRRVLSSAHRIIPSIESVTTT